MLCFYDFSIYLSRIYGLLCQSANYQTTYPPSGRVDRLSLPPSPSSGGIGLFLNRNSRQSSLNKGLSPTAAATQSQGHILPQEAGAHGHRDKLRRAFADSAAGASIVNAMGGMGRSSNGLCPPPGVAPKLCRDVSCPGRPRAFDGEHASSQSHRKAHRARPAIPDLSVRDATDSPMGGTGGKGRSDTEDTP